MTLGLLQRLAVMLHLYQQPLQVREDECAVGVLALPGTLFTLKMMLFGSEIRPLLTITRPGCESKSIQFQTGFSHEKLRAVGGSWRDFQNSAEISYDQDEDEDCPAFFIVLRYHNLRIEEPAEKDDLLQFFEYWEPEPADDNERDIFGLNA